MGDVHDAAPHVPHAAELGAHLRRGDTQGLSTRDSAIAAFGGLELLGQCMCMCDVRARVRTCACARMHAMPMYAYRVGHRRLDSLELLGTLLLEEGAAA